MCLLGQKYSGTWGMNTTIVKHIKNAIVDTKYVTTFMTATL